MRPTQVRTHAIRRAHENIDKTLKSAEVILGQFDLTRQVESIVLSCFLVLRMNLLLMLKQLVFNNRNLTMHFNTEAADVVSNSKGQMSGILLNALQH
ncbi:uncharacterized protein A4U43_C06F9610 [Asparagus officinalis]|uniref:Uncharacterized protein n=1 Tax=Asparagus officinalis TaxID=4686 RepID=A0A5P1EP46_ASPOF|nr:uncharacterized protein A4U43_C06F9610 [Asparagus officinalis]